MVSTRGHRGVGGGVRSASRPGERTEDSQQGLKQFTAPGIRASYTVSNRHCPNKRRCQGSIPRSVGR